MSIASKSTIHSDRSSFYLQQLCKHFGHRLEVEFTPEHGQITFDFGSCELDAEDGTQTMAARASDAEALAQVEEVICSHLKHFAHKEDLEVTWAPEAN